MAAAFDLSSGRNAFELRTPDTPVVLYATDALAALAGTGVAGSVAACHVGGLVPGYFRVIETGHAVCAFV